MVQHDLKNNRLSPTASQSVLVVDDEKASRQFFEYALTRNGYAPIMARDGIEALEALNNNWVDVILSDVAMPRLNGYQLYERVREKSNQDVRFAIVPFILLTARGMDSDVRYAKALGVDDYMVKPVLIEDLLAVIQGKIEASRMILAALGKRSSSEQAVFKINDKMLRIDFVQHRAWRDEQEVILSQREALALERLAKVPNQVVCTVELVSVTHGFEADNVEAGRLLRPLIRDLRSKIKREFGDTSCVQNVRGRGYMLALV